jgi:hypothetical protein
MPRKGKDQNSDDHHDAMDKLHYIRNRLHRLGLHDKKSDIDGMMDYVGGGGDLTGGRIWDKIKDYGKTVGGSRPKCGGGKYTESSLSEVLDAHETALKALSNPATSKKGKEMWSNVKAEAEAELTKRGRPIHSSDDYEAAESLLSLKEGEGRPRRPNARAAIVKKVMGEKGLSMIEASKYVKAHGLY